MKFSLSTGLVALPLLAAAQTFSTCNPTKQSCPPNPALGGTAFFDLKSAPGEFNNNGRVTFGGDGATFTISKTGEYATMKSKFYIMYGHVELVLRTAKGKGMVTSAHLQSDVLDEIDWEWLGGDPTQVLSNYFRLGKTETYDRGAYHPNPGNQDGFHTYSFDWTSDRIQWAIDGQVVRELTRAAAGSNYPQTPMNLHLGPWSGGDAAANPEGTVKWALGPIDWSTGPFVANIRSIRVTDYSTGSGYQYNDNSGTSGSISSVGGQINGSGSPGTTPDAPEVKPPVSSSPPSSQSVRPPPSRPTPTPRPETSSTDESTTSETGTSAPPSRTNTIETSASPTGTEPSATPSTTGPQTIAPNTAAAFEAFGTQSGLFALCAILGGLALF